MAFRAAPPAAAGADLVDLTDSTSPPVATAARLKKPPAAAAANVSVINLLDDDDSDENMLNHPPAAAAPRRYKTDPNERDNADAAAPSRKRARVLTENPVDEETIQVVGMKEAPVPPEAAVLEVFPDVDLNHVKTLLAQHDNNAQQVIAHMAENGSYPKSKVPPPAALLPTGGGGGGDGITVQMSTTERQWKYDYLSTNAETTFQPTKLYKTQAEQQLVFHFPCLTKQGALRVLQTSKFHYAVGHELVCNAIRGTTKSATAVELSTQYQRWLNVMENRNTSSLSQTEFRRLSAAGQPLEGCIRKKKPIAITVPAVTDDILREEIVFCQERLSQWKQQAAQQYHRAQNQQLAQATGTAVECSCCCDSFDVQDMVACRSQGHLFCCDCLSNFAKNQVFGVGSLGPADPVTKRPATELLCFHAEGCRSGFSRPCLVKALPPSTLEKYDALQFQISIDSAGLQNDVATCPKCGYKAVLPSQTQRIFACPVATCRFESCRECGEAAHIPLRCEEVEKESETKGRLTVEEAISAAKIRNCPKCKKPFLKSDGCNKITCGCGTKSCYICRKIIKDYAHFCQTPHCTHERCNKCPLWTKDEDDQEALRKAAVEAASRVEQQQQKEQQQQQQNNGGVGTKKQTKKAGGAAPRRIDVDGYLRPT